MRSEASLLGWISLAVVVCRVPSDPESRPGKARLELLLSSRLVYVVETVWAVASTLDTGR